MIWTSLIAQGKRRLWMSLLVATFVALVYVHFARFYQGRVSAWILAALGLPVFLNLLRAALGLAYRLDRHPFRSFDLGLLTDQVGPGQTLEVALALSARRPTTLSRLQVELRATRQRTLEKGREISILHRDLEPVEEGLALEPDSPKSYRVAFKLPPSAPYSFRSMEGKIVWLVMVSAEVAGWGELRDEIEVTVAPT
ncbi:MAG: hypothetical protein ACRD21_06575 [Vicinamibacteria bacterium]